MSFRGLHAGGAGQLTFQDGILLRWNLSPAQSRVGHRRYLGGDARQTHASSIRLSCVELRWSPCHSPRQSAQN